MPGPWFSSIRDLLANLSLGKHHLHSEYWFPLRELQGSELNLLPKNSAPAGSSKSSCRALLLNSLFSLSHASLHPSHNPHLVSNTLKAH